MKSKIYSLIILLGLVFSTPLMAQFSNAGTKSTDDPRYVQYTLQGRVNGTAGITSDAMELTNLSGPVEFTYYLSATDDSVKVSLSLLGSDHTGKTATLLTFANADSTETYKAVVDTVDARWLNNYYIYAKGSTGNGDSTYFYGTLKFPRKDN